jgi:5'-phosphate synthase pdxT subunit
MDREKLDLKIGVLALQGDFREHIVKLKECGIDPEEVRLAQQLKYIDGLIIPGGESTTIKKLLEKYNFKEELDKFNKEGKPIFGTCAGLILLANNIQNEGKGLGYIDIYVKRNAYGRQVDSFEELIEINFNHDNNTDVSSSGSEKNEKRIKFRSVFIRAPEIINTGKDVKIMAKLNGEAVLVRNWSVIACTFHPELTDDLSMHMYFKDMVKNYIEGK